MTPACMEPDELALWQAANAKLVARRMARAEASPCLDCPAWWAAEMRAQDCCNGEPGTTGGRPRLPAGTPPSQTPRYRRTYMDDYRARHIDRIRERDRARKRVTPRPEAA